MNPNIGKIDQVARFAIGLALVAYVFKDGTLGSIWPILLPIALILMITASLSFCPLYTLLGWNTEAYSRRTP